MFRRPGTWLLVILALGIFLLSRFEKTEEFVYRRSAMRKALREDENAACTLEGAVISKSFTENGFRVTAYFGKKAGLVRLYYEEGDLMPSIGQRIRVRGTPQLFKKAHNPGEFCMRSYADALGLSFQMRPDRTEILSGVFFPLSETVFRLKTMLQRRVKELAPEDSAGKLLQLLPGAYSASEEAAFSAADPVTGSLPGLSYLFRFSAAHISYSGLLLFRLVRKKLRRRSAAEAVSVFFSLFLSALTGFSLSSLRALLLLFFRLLCGRLHRRFDLLSAGSYVLLFLLLFRPALLFTPSVYVYLPVLFGFGLLYPELREMIQGKKGRFAFLMAPLAGAVWMLPVTLLREYAVSPYAGLLQLILYPLSRALFLLTFFAALLSFLFPAVGAFLLSIASVILNGTETLVRLFMKLPGAVLVRGCPESGKVLIYYSIALGFTFFLIFLSQKKRVKKAFPFLFLLFLYLSGILFLGRAKLPKDRIELTFLYVGQGDGILIRTRDTAIMIDGGSSDEEELSERVIRRALLYHGIGQLDLVCFTHEDKDHLSGTLPLLAGGFPAKLLLLPDTEEKEENFRDVLAVTEERRLPVHFAHRGEAFQKGDIGLTVLHPEEKSRLSGNASSLVLLLEYGDFTALFTGDIGAEEEKDIDPGRRVALLKGAHHGSRFSSSEEFLSRVRPRLTVFSAGRNNPYGHPSEEALLRIAEAGSFLLSTDKCGAVTVLARKDASFFVKSFDFSGE